MKVSAWWGGTKSKKTYGIYIGKPNREAYFDQSLTEVHIEMDGVTHTFELLIGFWRDCPEIKDRGGSIIKSWFQKHKIIKQPECHPPWPNHTPPKMKLIKLSMDKFRLEPNAIVW